MTEEKPQTAKAKLRFFDLQAKKPFETDEYEVEVKNGRRFAVAQNPSGSKSVRILGGKS